MQVSAELRWFSSGTLPKAIAQWFEQDSLGGYLSPPEEREDLYLLIPSCDYLGVKVRQKGLEVKWRQAQLNPARYGNHWEGKAEKWLKWVCADTFTPISPEIVATGQWISVKKKRWQRLYQVSPEGLTPVPVEAPIPQGCSVEITQLSMNQKAWWSLAFEAFGHENSLMDSLEMVANWASKSYQGPKLKADHAYSYPSWLNQ
ncbi:MAG: hypothetical protein ACM37W_08560 [Actinomycetota bacterium]